jgi:hypothetical protein
MHNQFLLISFCNSGGEMLDVSLGCYDLKNQIFHFLSFDGYSSNAFDMGCTGICVDDDFNFYVSVQSSTPRILVFNSSGRYFREITVLDAKDLHDIKFFNNKLFVVSTGNNRLYSVDLLNNFYVEECLVFDECQKDVVHFNSMLHCSNGTELYCFTANGPGVNVGSLRSTSGIIINNLNFPHSLFELDNCYVVLDSMSSKALLFDKTTYSVFREIKLDGFLRGICIYENFLYIGRCSHRIDSRKNPVGTFMDFDPEDSRCGLYKICLNDFTVIDFIDLSGYSYEIYDIVFANKIDDRFLRSESRLYSIYRKRKRIGQLEGYLDSAISQLNISKN